MPPSSPVPVTFWIAAHGQDYNNKTPRRLVDVYRARIARFYRREPKHPIPGTRIIRVRLHIPRSYLTLTEPVVELDVTIPDDDDTVTGTAGA